MPDQRFSVVNRVRFTAWAWLLSSFFVGLTVGAVATGIPLGMRLEAANESLSRLRQVRQLEVGLEQSSDVLALGASDARGPASRLEAPAPAALEPHTLATPQGGPHPAPVSRGPALLPATAAPGSEPHPRSADAAAGAPLEARAISADPSPGQKPQPLTAVLKAPAAAQASSLESAAAEAQRGQPTPPVAKLADRERKAKEDREEKRAKAEREQRVVMAQKAAREAEQREREAAEARAAAARGNTPAEPRLAARAEPPTTASAPAPASMNGPTERVTKDEAGLADVHAGAVVFKSGRRVSVGEAFPSGERLLSVDPTLGEIVTSRRRIVLKAS